MSAPAVIPRHRVSEAPVARMRVALDRREEAHMRQRIDGRGTMALVVMGLVLLGSAATATAATLNVANSGVDGPGCGTVASPCRTIGFALDGAVAGDVILVGPGRYGDVDADGIILGSAEEKPLEVDKPVVIRSTHGAGMTVFDAGDFVASTTGVRILVSNVTLGGARQGFTVTRASGPAIVVDSSTSGVRVEDCVAMGNGGGFVIEGASQVIVGNVSTGNQGLGFFGSLTGSELRANLASNNGDSGFSLHGAGLLIQDNVARTHQAASPAEPKGFLVTADGSVVQGNLAVDNRIAGFVFGAEGSPPPSSITVRNNVAMGNGTGIATRNGTHELTGNVAVSNLFQGFVLFGEGHRLVRNSAIGNGDTGFHVFAPDVTVINGNIFGNGIASTSTPANCGLVAVGVPVVATRNFWGAATGPGPDPADAVCVSGAGVVTTAPVATVPATISATAGRNPTDPQ